jgi:hypothetical protein
MSTHPRDPSDERWQQIIAAQGEVDNVVALPQLFNRNDGTPREASPEAVRFAEALAFTDHWSTMPPRGARRPDDLAA